MILWIQMEMKADVGVQGEESCGAQNELQRNKE